MRYGRRTGEWVDGYDEQMADEQPLVAVDDYEAEIDEALRGPAICDGYDCRDPREGPFVLDLSDRAHPTMYCWYCFAAERLRIDPAEIGRADV